MCFLQCTTLKVWFWLIFNVYNKDGRLPQVDRLCKSVNLRYDNLKTIGKPLVLMEYASVRKSEYAKTPRDEKLGKLSLRSGYGSPGALVNISFVGWFWLVNIDPLPHSHILHAPQDLDCYEPLCQTYCMTNLLRKLNTCACQQGSDKSLSKAWSLNHI